MKIKNFTYSIVLFLMFVIYTIVIKFVDVSAIGPNNSFVGFASINKFFANIFKYNEFFYDISKIIALFAFLFIGAFAIVGLVQLIKGKSFKKVDFEIYGMAVMYIITALFYVIFEIIVINYRPILEDGELEASFPSSHTMLAVSVFGCAVVYALKKMTSSTIRTIVIVSGSLFAALMALSRMISGVHWFTDILGGVLLGFALISFYLGICNECQTRKK